MSQTLQPQQQELSITQILRIYGKQFRQIIKLYSDELDGRCAIGVIMSYYGWDGKVRSHIANQLLAALKYGGIDKNLIVQLNDSGMADEIADYLDRQNELAKSNNDNWIDPLKWVKFLKMAFAI
ncbi:MAG: hypothetical protein GEU26_11750 [Nitrososphaeraceae archaeon]|nr:hypothetical protein [Nitrososphaeraceae archaeon]